MVTVLVPAALRDLADGEQRLEVDGATLRQVIRAVAKQHPALGARLMEDDEIGRGLSLAINDNVVSTGLLEPVPEGAVITIVPQISGG